MVAARESGTQSQRYEPWLVRLRHHAITQKILAVAAELLPKGLYARALLIIITPIVVLEGVIAFAFMERHW